MRKPTSLFVGAMTALLLMTLMGMAPLLGARLSFFDRDGGKPRTVGDVYPLPVRDGLTGKGVTNVTLEDCSDGGIPLNELDTLTAWFIDDGGSFTDDTTDANDAGTGDTTVFPATPVVEDALYIGHAGTLNTDGTLQGKFNAVKIDIGTQGSTSMTVTWEYFDNIDDDDSGSTEWDTLTFVRQDVVDFDEATGLHWNTFTPPADWVETNINGTRGYWIRARVSAFTSTSTSAVVDQAWLTTLDTDLAKQAQVRADTDETEDVWCKPIIDSDGLDVAADEGFVIDAGSGVHTVEFSESTGELICCGDGGTVDMAIYRASNGS